jgi:hypothetical protein
LAERDALGREREQWHLEHRGEGFDAAAYEAFLREIGYLHSEPAPFSITTANVDPEIAQIAGPQLVVPVMNARFFLNAAPPPFCVGERDTPPPAPTLYPRTVARNVAAPTTRFGASA